jgi:hypothetical protein
MLPAGWTNSSGPEALPTLYVNLLIAAMRTDRLRYKYRKLEGLCPHLSDYSVNRS